MHNRSLNQPSARDLSSAVAHHKAGRLADAERLYHQILADNPNEPEALHLLGLIAQQTGQPAAAVDLIRRAISNDATRPAYHHNLGILLEGLGRDDEAIASNRRALALDPTSFGGWFSLGNEYRATGRLERAADCYRRALELEPGAWEVHSNLGAVLEGLERHADAIEAYDRAITINPASADVHSNRGKALRANGRRDEAMAAFRRAIEINPQFAHAHSNLGAALLEAGRAGEAMQSIDACLAADPGNRSALALRIYALRTLGKREAADQLLDFENLLRARQWTDVPRFENVAALNAALASHVTSHPTLAWEPPTKSTRRGSQTRELLVEPKGPIAALEEMIHAAVTEYLEAVPADTTQPFLAHAPRHWRLNVWATLLEAQGHQLPHIHPGGWLSGVYYVALPEAVEREDHAGWIEFGRPPEPLAAGGESRIELIRPREGLMLLFPSYFYHRTLPFTAGGTRISIAFDVLPLARPVRAPMHASVDELVAQAKARYAEGSLAGAEEAARQALEIRRSEPRALHLLARAAYRNGRIAEAADYLRRALHAHPDQAQYHVDLANCLRVLQHGDEAAREMQRGLELGADGADAWQTMGVILADLGRDAEAEQAFRRALAKQPAKGSAWYGIARLKRFGPDDPDLEAMRCALARADFAGGELAKLHFALGRACEQADDCDGAFDHYRRGNELERSLQGFDARAEEENARRIVRAFTPQVFAAAAGAGDPSRLPVFVVGMPRSGTTLAEQILDSHPQVHGAGEINDLWRTVAQIGMYLPAGAALPEAIGAARREAWAQLAESYLEKLRAYAPSARRIVDKLPYNYTLLGLARLMFPNAFIIHCTRDPMDTCFSCYATSFSSDRGFTNSLGDLGITYRAYRTLMDYWRAVLPGGMLELRYESLVEDPEAESRRMIDYLGLEWSDECLDFHINERAVSTASHSQVRRPVYRTSIGRWRRFERHLDPLHEALSGTLTGGGA